MKLWEIAFTIFDSQPYLINLGQLNAACLICLTIFNLLKKITSGLQIYHKHRLEFLTLRLIRMEDVIH
jgi:hypothetical protein